jgi:DNA repair exonuclease SbcCD ATPase subunit
MERFGVEKREILVDRVEAARESQAEAGQQFETALDEFIAVTGYQGGDLEAQYRKLKDAFEESESRAEEVHERIGKVQDVAEALFEEWEAELAQYSSNSLRQQSQRQLNDTRSRYRQLLAAMQRAEKRIDPVLNAFRDRVLYLKHNLNARAVGSLRGDVGKVQADVGSLLKDMQRSISEADDFIAAMGDS